MLHACTNCGNPIPSTDAFCDIDCALDWLARPMPSELPDTPENRALLRPVENGHTPGTWAHALVESTLAA